MTNRSYELTDASFAALRDQIESVNDIAYEAKAHHDEAREVLLGYTALADGLDDRTAELARSFASADRYLTAAIDLQTAVNRFAEYAPGIAVVTKMRYAVAVIEAHAALREFTS